MSGGLESSLHSLKCDLRALPCSQSHRLQSSIDAEAFVDCHSHLHRCAGSRAAAIVPHRDGNSAEGRESRQGFHAYFHCRSSAAHQRCGLSGHAYLRLGAQACVCMLNHRVVAPAFHRLIQMLHDGPHAWKGVSGQTLVPTLCGSSG